MKDEQQHQITTTSTTTSTTTPPPPSTISTKKPISDDIEITSFCNDPGKPAKSQISPVQLTYTDGDRVVYTCDNFISLKQYKKCIDGKWHGDTPICGKLTCANFTAR